MVTQETNKWVYTPPVKPVTPKDIYGTDTPQIPKGYEIVDFRVPRLGDVVRCTWGGIDTVLFGEIWPEPRFILAKLPAQPATAPDGYEFTGEYRQVESGEYYYTRDGLAMRYLGFKSSVAPWWILRPVPTPTLKSIYGTDTPVIPEGWESTGVVRVPAIGDPFLSLKTGVITCASGNPTTTRGGGQRLILRKKAAPVKSEPKFKVGDRVYHKDINKNGTVVALRAHRDDYDVNDLRVEWDNNWGTYGTNSANCDLIAPAPNFKVGDWVKGDTGYYSAVGKIAKIDGWAILEDDESVFYLEELTPVAAPPAGFKYTKV